MSETAGDTVAMTGPSGPLYDLLMQKLPDFVDEHSGRERLKIYQVADAIGVTYQSIYYCLPNEKRPALRKLSTNLATKFIELSEKTAQSGDEFVPLSWNDLGPHLRA